MQSKTWPKTSSTKPARASTDSAAKLLQASIKADLRFLTIQYRLPATCRQVRILIQMRGKTIRRQLKEQHPRLKQVWPQTLTREFCLLVPLRADNSRQRTTVLSTPSLNKPPQLFNSMTFPKLQPLINRFSSFNFKMANIRSLTFNRVRMTTRLQIKCRRSDLSTNITQRPK